MPFPGGIDFENKRFDRLYLAYAADPNTPIRSFPSQKDATVSVTFEHLFWKDLQTPLKYPCAVSVQSIFPNSSRSW